MKENKKYWLIILICSILIMIPAMNGKYYKGHDTNFHVANISSLSNQISWSNPFVKEPLANIANGLGYGTRFFYPPVPHLIAAYLTKIFQNVIIGMRLTQWITIFLSGIAFYLLGQKIFKNKKISLFASIAYMTAPYHLAEIFIRDAFSEMFIPIAVPLIILGLLELINQKPKQFFIYFTLGYTLAIYSHIAMSIYFTIIILLTFFTIYFKKIFTKQNILYLCISAVLILSLTSPFWVPLLEHKLNCDYTIFIPYYITGKGDLRFSAINPLIYLNFSLPHTYDFIRYHLQFIVTVLMLIGIILFFKKKLWKEKQWLFVICFTILSIIMTSPLFPWYYTPDILQTLQFPWRLCIYVALGVILCTGITLKNIEQSKYFNKICIIGILICLGGSYYYTYHVNEDTIDISNINYNLGMGNQEEYLPAKVIANYDYYKNRKQEIIKLSGEGDISIKENQFPNITFEVTEVEDLTIEMPRLYYLGYIIEKEGNQIEVAESENGFLEANIKEEGTYTLIYNGTIWMKISKLIALFVFLGCIASLLLQRKK